MNDRFIPEKKSLLRDTRQYLQQLEEEGIEYVLTDSGPERARCSSSPVPTLKTKSPPPLLPHLHARELLLQFQKKVTDCRACRLAETRSKVVFGEGGMRKGVLFIGEGPGANEDRSGRPFVGRAGKLLDKILASIGLTRKDIFITNIVKCRPPQNREPRPDEIVACWPHLEKQIELLKPRVIMALGSPAAKTLLETSQGISKLRGVFHNYEGIPLLATYHPAYLLRSYTTENRKKVWEDVKKLKEFLESDRGGS